MSQVDPYAVHDFFVPVWADVLRLPGVTLQDAYVYGLLATYRGAGPGGECRPALRRLAKDLGIDRRNVRRHLRRLEAAGLIVIDTSGNAEGRPNRYHFQTPEVINAPGSDIAPGIAGAPGSPQPGGAGRPQPGGNSSPQPGGGHRHPRVDPQSRSPEKIPPQPPAGEAALELHHPQPKAKGRKRTPKGERAQADPRVQRIFERYRHRLGRSDRYLLTPKRASMLLARLEEGRAEAELLEAIDALAASDWHRVNGHLDLELVCRSAEKLDKMLDRARARPRTANGDGGPRADRGGPRTAAPPDAFHPDVDPFATGGAHA